MIKSRSPEEVGPCLLSWAKMQLFPKGPRMVSSPLGLRVLISPGWPVVERQVTCCPRGQNWGTGLPGGSGVKNLPASAGDWPGKIPHAAEQPSPCSRAGEPQLLKPERLEAVLCNQRGQCNGRPAHCNERAAPALNHCRKPAQERGKAQCSQR